MLTVDLQRAIQEAAVRLAPVIFRAPSQRSNRLSKRYGADVLIKREDLQEVRSFKIRGAYNRIDSNSPEERQRGVVCASAFGVGRLFWYRRGPAAASRCRL